MLSTKIHLMTLERIFCQNERFGALYAYDFGRNIIPGEPVESNSYWRDVGTLDAYYEANMDLRYVNPAFNLYNKEWPIHSNTLRLPPAKFVHLGLTEQAKRLTLLFVRELLFLVLSLKIVLSGLTLESIVSARSMVVSSWKVPK